MAREGVCGSGVGTSFVDMVEVISHRPGQDGDESNSSNVKERGCGLWRRVSEEDSVLPFFSEDLLEFRPTCSFGGPGSKIGPGVGHRPSLPTRDWRSATHPQ